MLHLAAWNILLDSYFTCAICWYIIEFFNMPCWYAGQKSTNCYDWSTNYAYKHQSKVKEITVLCPSLRHGFKAKHVNMYCSYLLELPPEQRTSIFLSTLLSFLKSHSRIGSLVFDSYGKGPSVISESLLFLFHLLIWTLRSIVQTLT